jgi:hypothetical protein
VDSLELRQIFEPLVQDLIKTINSQMSSLPLLHSSNQIRYIVLSGGLGSSKYIERRLRDEYCTGISRPRNANNLEILTAAEPQLAVVKGLVMDRSQALHRGVVVYTGKCCRVSYGAICRLPYDSKLHYGESTIRDQFTKELWVEDQIDWLIREVRRPLSLTGFFMRHFPSLTAASGRSGPGRRPHAPLSAQSPER